MFNANLFAPSHSDNLASSTFMTSSLTLVVRLPGVPGSPRRTRRRLPGVPGSKKKNIYFFFKMCNGKDSDMLVVIVGQYCSA